MKGYCKNCQCSHAAWTRLNNGFVCGLCGSRERDLRVMRFNVLRPTARQTSTQNHNQQPS